MTEESEKENWFVLVEEDEEEPGVMPENSVVGYRYCPTEGCFTNTHTPTPPTATDEWGQWGGQRRRRREQPGVKIRFAHHSPTGPTASVSDPDGFCFFANPDSGFKF